jgi:hypothetical protein
MMEAEVTAILRAANERGLRVCSSGVTRSFASAIRGIRSISIFLPEDERSPWLDLLRQLGYRFFHGDLAFAQFEPPHPSGMPVDLMFVEKETWENLLLGRVG